MALKEDNFHEKTFLDSIVSFVLKLLKPDITINTKSRKKKKTYIKKKNSTERMSLTRST